MRYCMIILVIMGLWYSVTLSATVSECNTRVSISEAESIARRYLDNIREVKLKKRKGKDTCYYIVKGSNGKLVIDADSGDVISFRRLKKSN